jgi:hypothetical protein
VAERVIKPVPGIADARVRVKTAALYFRSACEDYVDLGTREAWGYVLRTRHDLDNANATLAILEKRDVAERA